MFSRLSTKANVFSLAQRNFHVAVVGAAGGIGQPLSLLLKLNSTGLITKLSLYDVAPVTPGVAVDLSHIPTSVVVEGYAGEENMYNALKGADVVVVPAGVPRKPGMTRDDLFNVNATINANIATVASKACPNANFLIISNPVNSTVPIWAKVLEKNGVFNPSRLFGVTTLDVFRANTLASNKKHTAVNVPVIGGHAGETIVPLFSLASQDIGLQGEELDKSTHAVMFGGDEVVKAKGGLGSATLSMASAGAKFTESVLLGLSGKVVVGEVAYVRNPTAEKQFGTKFFSTQVDLGKEGVVGIHDTVSKASEYEQGKVDAMIGQLKGQIAKGEEFGDNFTASM